MWRKYINNQLSGIYAQLFSEIDYLMMLKVPDMESIYDWRLRQENNLKSLDSIKHRMTEQQIIEFIQYFERITQTCLNEMPSRVDLLLCLNKHHQIDRVKSSL